MTMSKTPTILDKMPSAQSKKVFAETKITNFKSWLAQNGAEILPKTNEYEAVRFKGKETGVLYNSGRFSGDYARAAWDAFTKGKKWDGFPISTGRKATYKAEKKKILLRDGCACFYCAELMGEDITLEHLVPLTAGGQNNLSNMVLAHEDCNNKMGFKHISEKVAYAVKMRVEKITKQ